MSKNKVSDPITDQEIAFAHLILSGTMTDRRAAEAVGLNPDSAAYTKAKPRVRDYMLEHRAAVREKLVDQEAEGLRKLNPDPGQILTRLWELANLSPEATRGSITGQVKAVSLIIALEGLIPDRRASASKAQPTAPPLAGCGKSPRRAGKQRRPMTVHTLRRYERRKSIQRRSNSKGNPTAKAGEESFYASRSA